MKRSIIRRLQFSMYGFGIVMGAVFPFYAAIFDDAGGSTNSYFRIGCYAAGIVMGLFCFGLVKLTVLRELKKIDTFAEALKNNDLTVDISLNSDDELGQIVNNLSSSTTTMKTLLTNIHDTSKLLHSSLSEMKGFSKHLETTASDLTSRSHKMTGTVNTITTNSHVISDSVSETVTSVETISSEIATLSTTLDEVNSLCVSEKQISHEVYENLQNTKESILELASNSSSIEEITDTIKSIADQTNLLAINAAVEAAIAGQYGKSFSVVANEVKTLADESLKSAKSIASLLDTIRPIIESSKEMILSGSSKMEIAASQAETIAELTNIEVARMDEIKRELQRSKNTMERITSAITESSSEIDNSAQQISQVNISIDSVSGNITRERHTILALEKSAKELTESAERFKLTAL